MLSEQEREQLRAEEAFRAALRQELNPSRPPSPWWQAENIKWLLSAIAIPLTTYIWGEYEKAAAIQQLSREREEREQEDKRRNTVAEAQRNLELVVRLLPDLSKHESSKERLNAMVVLKTIEQQGQFGTLISAALEANAPLSASVDTNGKPRDDGQRREIEVLSAGAPNSEQLLAGREAPRYAQGLPGTKLYIQYFEESQAPIARTIQQLAQSKGWVAPGIENVVKSASRKNAKAPSGYDTTVLLVFHEQDLAAAESLVLSVAQSVGIKPLIRTRWDNARYAAVVPKGQLELWLTAPPANQRSS